MKSLVFLIIAMLCAPVAMAQAITPQTDYEKCLSEHSMRNVPADQGVRMCFDRMKMRQ
ncbi:hypothetical protein [Robbsia sp. KACC 23696]|uniref:hypothetical protein n=1 Tax=Robbsia sp. KACC 23696 TaxID=3149231 RepID=UPI00325AE0D0